MFKYKDGLRFYYNGKSGYKRYVGFYRHNGLWRFTFKGLSFRRNGNDINGR